MVSENSKDFYENLHHAQELRETLRNSHDLYQIHKRITENSKKVIAFHSCLESSLLELDELGLIKTIEDFENIFDETNRDYKKYISLLPGSIKKYHPLYDDFCIKINDIIKGVNSSLEQIHYYSEMDEDNFC